MRRIQSMEAEKKATKPTGPLIPVKTSDEADERESQGNSRDAEIAGDRPPHHVG